MTRVGHGTVIFELEVGAGSTEVRKGEARLLVLVNGSRFFAHVVVWWGVNDWVRMDFDVADGVGL